MARTDEHIWAETKTGDGDQGKVTPFRTKEVTAIVLTASVIAGLCEVMKLS